MARKGQKFKTYTAEFWKNIVKEIEQTSLTYVAQKYKVNIKTIDSWQRNFKKKNFKYTKRSKITIWEKRFKLL